MLYWLKMFFQGAFYCFQCLFTYISYDFLPSSFCRPAVISLPSQDSEANLGYQSLLILNAKP